MTISVIITAFLLIATKLADCLTTIRFINRRGIGIEQNKIANRIMIKLGGKTTVWLLFLITILIVTVVLWQILAINNILYSSVFIIFGVFISIIQLAVALYNYSGKSNFIIVFIRKFSLYK